MVNRIVKKEIRILGIDDSPFEKNKRKRVLIVGAVFRGGTKLEGVITTYINVDGRDSTRKITKLINETRHREQLQIVMLDGIAFGGFNVVDIKKLAKNTKLPIVTIMRSVPNMKKIKNALKNVSFPDRRLKIIKKAGKIHEAGTKRGKIFFQCCDIEPEKVREILDISCLDSNVPEPIRTAHLIAAGVVKGESKGRA